jgi:protein-tyrosine-phosphatase
MVCTGRICRSPKAEGYLAARLPDLAIDSAVIMDRNVGRPPHQGTRAVTLARGVRRRAQRVRQFTAEDLRRFGVIPGVDDYNMVPLSALRPSDAMASVGWLGVYLARGRIAAIADPWGQENAMFETIFLIRFTRQRRVWPV